MHNGMEHRLYEKWRDPRLFKWREGHWGILLLSRATYWEGVDKSEPNSFQRYAAVWEEATDTTWDIQNSKNIHWGKKNHRGCDETPTQIAKSGCEISILKDIKNLSGEAPEHAVLSNSLDQMTPKSLFQCKLFCDNLILKGSE